MRQDLLCHARTLLRVLPKIGQSENASAIARRVEDDTFATWIVTSAYGAEVLAEITGALETASTFAATGSELSLDIRHAVAALAEILPLALEGESAEAAQ